MNTRICLTLLAAVSWTASYLAAETDPVVETVKEAMDYYKEGDYAGAAASLDYASQMIRQKRSEGLTEFLPEPLEGWSAEDASSQASGAAMFGGGTSAEREYTKGDANVKVQIMTDSPMLQGVAMMINNPMFAGADGGKLERISKQKALVKYDDGDRSGSINLMVAGTILITIEGNDVDLDDLRAYAEAIDYAAIAAQI
ncbi:MAG: hypothetical protein R3F07_01485 [Opitutaceae bacterium]